ncbi:cytochrome P450 [Actinorugispora endophytica]|uniref:Cytochrome P450 n=1 Tax=Actinorugispora endophytica TaxID=1605990 RepID=A0A4V6PWW7_9ACTN|nr:cytochrome P450 [Actinorugispora endophytica]TDQ54169.1 cytochrome P450 [Actinorugispora endophytica]
MTSDSAAPLFPFPDEQPLTPSARLAAFRRSASPVRVRLPFGGGAWLVTRHEDARLVLSSPRFGRDAERAGIAPDGVPRMTPVDPVGANIAALDPPDHTRVRGLVARVFTPRRVEALRPRIQGIAEELVEEMAAAGSPADLVDRLALPLPVEVICELLGVPSADRPRFRSWTDTLVDTSGRSPEAIGRALADVDDYLLGLAVQRAGNPTDDLIGALARVRGPEGGLAVADLRALLRPLLIAGHDTTASQIANFTYLLLRGGDYPRLAADPGLVPGAVEELLRYVPLLSIGSFPRFALADTDVGGVTVRAGESVIVELSAANRDPDVFEDPDTLDIGRGHNPHIGFGHGAHHCVGAALARTQLRAALEALARRLPGLALAGPPHRVRWREETFVRGPRELPVRW